MKPLYRHDTTTSRRERTKPRSMTERTTWNQQAHAVHFQCRSACSTVPSIHTRQETGHYTLRYSSTTVTTTSCSVDYFPSQFLHFLPLFSTDFGSSALLYAAPTLTNTMNYGEGFNPFGANDSFSISRPTIELGLDEILVGEDIETGWSVSTSDIVSSNTTSNNNKTNSAASQQDVMMQSLPAHSYFSYYPILSIVCWAFLGVCLYKSSSLNITGPRTSLGRISV